MMTNSHTVTNPASAEDIVALKLVDELLAKLQKTYDKKDVFMSPENGDVMIVEEVSRVRGILSFLTNNTEMYVNP